MLIKIAREREKEGGREREKEGRKKGRRGEIFYNRGQCG
jgi:hypothetical protein